MNAFASRIDHTALGVDTTLDDVRTVIEQAATYGMNACIPPCFVGDIETEVCLMTVIGFPHGNQTTVTKRTAAVGAVDAGCDELDVVMNVGRLKAGDDDAVLADLQAVTDAVEVPVKVIVETPVLTNGEKHRAGTLASAAGADYVKTATGFADGGATVPDVELLSEYLPVKASGGINSYATARALLEAGAERLGASSGAALVKAHRT